VQQLLGQQRSIAETLQSALLPEDIPPIPGIEVAVRYIPGATGVEIGGDWYDVLPLDDHRFFFVVGDVSGRGVRAGAVMASMHFAIRGFVSEGHSPATILDILSGMLHIGRHGHFATVLCGIADIDSHELTMANAGHLPPLLIDDVGGQFLSTQVGPPIGVTAHTPYGTTTFSVPAHATLIAYSDGLVERRNEDLDHGLQRLEKSAVSAHGASLEDVLTTVVTELTQDAADDDTAILGLRWLN
jgi:serine phosphatase RsbU (regulator of sigma subunit)